MFDNTYDPTTPLHLFFEEHSQGLQNAALLLGGKPYLRRTQLLIDDLRHETTLTRRIECEVVALYELLTLEHVHDIDRPEAAYFALLDPAMSHVEEICLLTEGLENAAAESRALAQDAVCPGAATNVHSEGDRT